METILSVSILFVLARDANHFDLLDTHCVTNRNKLSNRNKSIVLFACLNWSVVLRYETALYLNLNFLVSIVPLSG